jgi:uncharacterized protein YcaQ
MRERISAAEARRIVLAAQGFGKRPAGPPSSRAMLAAIRKLGVVQIDSVNVLVRSHYLPLFSRLGAYPRAALEKLAYAARGRSLYEYWGHEASLLPIELYPHFAFRRDRARNGEGTWGSLARIAHERKPLVRDVERQIAERGAMAAGELEGYERAAGSWWGWSDHKRALEYLFWSGRLSTKTRRNFERVYDLTERVIPAAIRERDPGSVAEQQRALLAIAARALGVATERDLRDYFRLSGADARPRVAELVEAGTIRPIAIEGLSGAHYLHAEARLPRAIEAAALLSPFDSLVWQRKRSAELFDFTFRLEIYTPAHKRVHGYYVLPLLLDERLAARVDLKSDRAAGALRVRSLHLEPGVKRGDAVARLRVELRRMADWLELERIDAPALRGSRARD